jgi:hypothetical protein
MKYLLAWMVGVPGTTHSPVDVIQRLQIAAKSATRERHHDRNCGRSDRGRSACVVLGRSHTGNSHRIRPNRPGRPLRAG